MKFTCSVDIDAPLDKVIKCFENPSYLDRWQEDFDSFTSLSGNPREVGGMNKLLYNVPKKNKQIQLIETIEKNNLPNQFVALYEHKHMINTMDSRFLELNNGMTRWTAHLNYSKINGFLPKAMSLLFPGMFKMQTQKWLDNFKDFVENNKII